MTKHRCAPHGDRRTGGLVLFPVLSRASRGRYRLCATCSRDVAYWLNCDLPRGLIFSWLAGSSAAPRTSRPHNGCSRPIGSPHVSTGWARALSFATPLLAKHHDARNSRRRRGCVMTLPVPPPLRWRTLRLDERGDTVVLRVSAPMPSRTSQRRPGVLSASTSPFHAQGLCPAISVWLTGDRCHPRQTPKTGWSPLTH